MAAATEPHSDYYIYVLFRENGAPFYIGKGRKKRWFVHEQEVRRGRSYKDNIICDMMDRGVEVPKVKLAQWLTSSQAAAYEIAWIAALGRHPNGPLTNRTAGGDGCRDMTPDIRAKIAASVTGKKYGPPSAETRQKISKAQIGRKRGRQPDEVQAKRSEALKRAWADPENSARWRKAGMRGREHSPETKEKIRQAALARVDEKTREKMRAVGQANKGKPGSNGMLGKKHTDEWRARMSELHKRRLAENRKSEVGATSEPDRSPA